MTKISAVAVVGSTASGKTALAIELARRLGGEIIICDSMQVYRGMDVGTAKPTAEELEAVPHHLVDICDPDVKFSASDYAPLATAAARAIVARGRLPIFCGGTGLYLDSLLRGHAPEELTPSYELREELMRMAEGEGGREALHRELALVDPASAAVIHPNNVRRVIRALEIYRTSGKTKTEWDREVARENGEFDMLTLVLSFHSRETLYRRIEQRVDRMFDMGLVDETRHLHACGALAPDTTAGQAIGYKELIDYIEGRESEDAARERLKLATRRYAKRQETWFNSHKKFTFVYADDENGDVRDTASIADECVSLIRNHFER